MLFLQLSHVSHLIERKSQNFRAALCPLRHLSTPARGLSLLLLFSHYVVSDSLRPHGMRHARFLCPPLSPEVCSNSCLLSWWCYLTISSSATLFSTHCPLHRRLTVSCESSVMALAQGRGTGCSSCLENSSSRPLHGLRLVHLQASAPPVTSPAKTLLTTPSTLTVHFTPPVTPSPKCLPPTRMRAGKLFLVFSLLDSQFLKLSLTHSRFSFISVEMNPKFWKSSLLMWASFF